MAELEAGELFPSPTGYRPPPADGRERDACISVDSGFHIRHPPAQHTFTTFITPEDQLFQTIHMGAANVDIDKYILVIDGLVNHPLSLKFDDLLQLPKTTITSFHECFGSPLKPAVQNLWRIGNVTWTGVRLQTLLNQASPLPEAQFVWSEGLDSGIFADVKADRYQKDLPMSKAMSEDVLVVYEMNGQPLGKERGGPVRLVVPGWFGTNSTKWLCRLSLQAARAPGPYTTKFYNVPDPEDPTGDSKPVWKAQPNSMVVKPKEKDHFTSEDVHVEGWAWSHDGVKSVSVSIDGKTWKAAQVRPRKDFSWQFFQVTVQVPSGPGNSYNIIARATSVSDISQPLVLGRNHVHRVMITTGR